MMNLKFDSQLVIFLMTSWAAGLALGGFYFMSLWHTVRQLPSAKSPIRLMIVSFMMRMAVVLVGFYLVMGGEHWERLAAAMLGFIVIRKILTHRLGPQNAVVLQTD